MAGINCIASSPVDVAPQGPISQEEAPKAGDSKPAPRDAVAVTDPSLVRQGGDRRTIFRLSATMKKLELQLPYEGSNQQPMTLGSVDNFKLLMAVHPSTMQLDASLGNFIAYYGALPEANPSRTICSLRSDTTGSLIDVTFRVHSAGESFQQPAVPDGLPYYSVVAKLSAVQLVYMQRYLNEFLEYLSVMLSLQPPSKTATSMTYSPSGQALSDFPEAASQTDASETDKADSGAESPGASGE